MNRTLIFITLIISIFIYNCSSSVQILPEPIKNKNLLIGSLIFDIDGYEDNFATIRQNIEIVDGEYAIKGFRTHLIGLGNLTIENELIDPQRNYFELKTEDTISMTGELFDIRANQRIINFHHNIITVHRSGIIDNRRYDRLQDVKLSTGEVLTNPPVPSYFLEKFEGTGWENI